MNKGHDKGQMSDREVMKLALESLKEAQWFTGYAASGMTHAGWVTNNAKKADTKTEEAISALRQALKQPEQEPHRCELNSPHQAYGVAIDDCYEDDEGRFWAGNGEYGSQVNYCPVCGTKAPKQVDGRRA